VRKIEDLGWDAFFESNRKKLELDGFSVARVIAEYKGAYKVKNAEGEYAAKITGKQMFDASRREDYPAVGDWVAIAELPGGQAVIKAILPRRSIIKRKSGDKNKSGEKGDTQIIATNIDAAFIVESVGRDFSLNRLERYLAIISDEGIAPVILINKADLISKGELDLRLEEIKNRLGDIRLIATSTINEEGLDKLKNYIKKGKTYCFLGSSGVGKSSLINALLGEETIRTGAISARSDRGKHVTTNRETYFLKSGGIVIDNPGIREVGLADAGAGVDELFGEMTALAGKCKYADCTHIHEPECEILLALKEGRLDEKKYANYISLKKETEYSGLSDAGKREKNRNFGKFIKRAKKELQDFAHKDY
jgi:ribosome biogenesis GTPase